MRTPALFRWSGSRLARQQVVAGLNVALSLDVKQGQNDRQAEAVVWHKLSGEYELTSWSWIADH